VARIEKISITIEDVNGSFARLLKQAPKEARSFLSQAVATTTTAVAQRMRAHVPVDEGELKAAIDTRLPRGTRLVGEAGVWDTAQGEVALYNEYQPNKQPFMRPAAQDESDAFKQRAIRALKKLESAFQP
jgi:hypothetical protein